MKVRWGHPIGFVALLFACLSVVGCRERPREPSRATVSATAAARQPVSAPAESDQPSRPYRFPAAKRLVAIGDLHGDLAATRSVLRLAGAIDEGDRWVGHDLVVVQTGDQLDRGDDEPEILDLLDRLATDAERAGGAVHVLNGNHELMNVAGDFRYVTPGGLADFADVTGEGQLVQWAQQLPPKMRGRAHAFLPGGVFARRLGRRNTVVVVGRTVFAHGGVLPAHVAHGIGRLNDEVRRWMTGATPSLSPLAQGEESPVWTRRYSSGSLSSVLCAELEGVLLQLEVERLVVGHTVQKDGISSACDGRVWRVDVGMARHYGGTVAALEIREGQTRVLTAEP